MLGSNTSTPRIVDRHLAVLRGQLHVRLAEDGEQVAGPGLLQQLVAHRQVRVHPHRQHGQLAELDLLRQLRRLLVDARLERERADEQQVALAPLDRFQRGLLDVGVAERAELRADADADGRAGVRLALGVDVLAGEGVEPGEGDALLLVRPLHAGLAEVVEDHRQEVAAVGAARPRALRSRRRLGAVGRLRCGDRLSTVNGPVSRTMSLSS